MSLSEQQILDLFQKHLEGELTDSEKQCLEREAAQNKNIEVFLNYLEFQAEDSIEDLEIELIYEKSRPNSLPEDIPQSTPRNRPRGTKKIIWSIAASIVIAAITWLAVIQLESSHPEEHWS